MDLPDPMQQFSEAPFDTSRLTFDAPTSIQAQAWPIVLQQKDLIAVARTGSGKTLGFLLPAIHMSASSKGPAVLILAPTRELACQITEECKKYSEVSCCCIYGGVPKPPQVAELKKKPHVVVATPGRLCDVLEMGAINLKNIKVLVLDEADRMLDMGFEPQITQITKELPEENRQTLFFTATWPKSIQKMTGKMLKDPVLIRIAVSEELTANTNISQKFFPLDDTEKPAKLWQILDEVDESARVIVFCNTKRRCEQLVKDVWASGYNATAIHGDKSQQERDRGLADFIAGKAPVMFATDVAARGLDIKNVTLVVNYDMAADVENYIHRIGRTGRAGATGASITFCNEGYDIPCSPALVKIASEAGAEVPNFLVKWCEKAKNVKTNKHWKY